jgi:hypothetical protein
LKAFNTLLLHSVLLLFLAFFPTDFILAIIAITK